MSFEQMVRVPPALMLAQRVHAKIGVVTSYNPDRYQAKVALQPRGQLSGWLPIATQWAGNQWGLYVPPSPGSHVIVAFVEGAINAGVILGMLFSNAIPPISVPAGEMLMQHSAGSLLQFFNDGTVKLVSNSTLTTQATQWNHTGPLSLDGNLAVTGNITATGTITPNV